MLTKFYNGYIFLPNKIISGEVLVNDSVIECVSKKIDVKPDREIDLKGNLLFPGFNNAHAHSAMTFLRSLADDLPLDEWLKKQVFPREALLTSDDIYYLTKLAILEYVEGGITSCFDMYFFPDSFVSACIESGFRAVLCSAVNDTEGFSFLEDYYNKYNNVNPLISYKLGFHAEYTTSENVLKDISILAHKYKAPVFSHLSETRKETLECISRHNMTPTEYLDSLGLYDYGGGGFHTVHMTDNDIEIFRRKKLFSVTNPCSNAKLASGIAPLRKIIDSDITLALGTDGAASNNSLDFFKEMYLASVLSKLRENDAKGVTPREIIKAATEGGAKCMGIKSGKIEKGFNADLIIIDLSAPNMALKNNIVSDIVYSANKSNVIFTMIAGKILYDKGEFFIGESPERIYEKSKEIVKRISLKV